MLKNYALITLRGLFRNKVYSFIIATPLAWWALRTYLERYTIRTDVHW
ncbi:MAG: hypothetical protein WA960_08430 [Tunicatimonas sp.]